jgi:hypothetical protein
MRSESLHWKFSEEMAQITWPRSIRSRKRLKLVPAGTCDSFQVPFDNVNASHIFGCAFSERSQMPSAGQFRSTLNTVLSGAALQKLPSIDVSAGWLHGQVGQYPGPNHRMPVCCEVMRNEMRQGDVILNQPPKGNGASLNIRYMLPRA